MKNIIYLISDTGAATSTTDGFAQMLEEIGFRRCSNAEYQKKKRWQMRKEATETKRMIELECESE